MGSSFFFVGNLAHELSVLLQAVMGWFARDAVQSAREACGGQGQSMC